MTIAIVRQKSSRISAVNFEPLGIVSSTPAGISDSPQAALAAIAERFLAALIGGDRDALVKTVGVSATIDDPHLWRIVGSDAIRAIRNEFDEWLGGSDACVQHVRTTGSDERVCSEDALHLTLGDCGKRSSRRQL